MARTTKPVAKKVSHKAKASNKKAIIKRSLADFDAPMRSFRVSRDTLPFFGLRVTRQTAYWVILMMFIMIMQIWILTVQVDILKSTNTITSLL